MRDKMEADIADKEADIANKYQVRINNAMNNPEVPKIYCNGFVNTLGTGDILTVLERNGSPVAVLNMSYTVAKSLAAAIGAVVSNLETKTGREMLTTNQMEIALSSSDPKDAGNG